jgi:NAD(P)-dependent dehydrogenase (short-subunit alcohol dehydrogenase family)
MQYILVTGVSSGIGYDAARYFIQNGYTVLASVRKQADKQRLESEFPNDFHCFLFDVTDRDAIRIAAIAVREVLGDNLLTALVNNAGVAVAGPMQFVDDDRFEEQMRINVVGTRNVTNAFLPMLGARSNRPAAQEPGKIINISSISGILNTPINGSYCVAKHAMESLGEVYRRELFMYGIDVVSIQPGPIQSEIWNKNMDSMTDFAGSDYAPMIRRVNEIMKQAQRVAG